MIPILCERLQIKSSALNTMKSRGNLMAPMPGQAMPNTPGTVTTNSYFSSMLRTLWTKSW